MLLVRDTAERYLRQYSLISVLIFILGPPANLLRVLQDDEFVSTQSHDCPISGYFSTPTSVNEPLVSVTLLDLLITDPLG